MFTKVPAAPRSDDALAVHLAALASSRRALLDAVPATAEPFTLIRGIGNLGDQLIAAGARQLFAGAHFREVSIEEAVRSRGATAVLMGSGAWCEPFHEVMPAALDALVSRYARVVVLPSTFDVSVQEVRRALKRSGAVVFARERESYRQIASLCDARLAYDTSFFFDYAPYCAAGSGVLHAYRTDAEATGRFPLPGDNWDISVELGSLDEWLWTIARHEAVHTDRAHVMIAAALLGKRVAIHPSGTHKVPAIAEYALGGFPVHASTAVRPLLAATPPSRRPAGDVDGLRERLQKMGEASLRRIPAEWLDRGGPPRVTVVVVSWNRLEQTKACIASLAANVHIPFRLRVVDNGSETAVREALARLCAEYPFAELQQLETNHGCAGGRQLGAAGSSTEYIVFVDDDAEVFPGTVEHLVYALDAHTEARVAGACVVLPNGLLQFCGGDYHVRDGVVRFETRARERALDDDDTVSETCGFIPGTAFACRRDFYTDFPLDAGMARYFEDNEWCYRIHQVYPQAFRTAPDALVLHHQETKERRGSAPAELQRTVPFIAAISHFYTRHGLVLDDLFGFVPELVLADGTRDVAAARLLLELVAAKGGEWLSLQWVTGGLAPFFLRKPLSEVMASRAYRLARLYWSACSRAARLLRRVLR